MCPSASLGRLAGQLARELFEHAANMRTAASFDARVVDDLTVRDVEQRLIETSVV